MILKEIGDEHRDRSFAIVIDEAHSGQGGRTAAQMNVALGAAGAEGEDETVEDRINRAMEARKMLPNASYFAFTATPKGKTIELFGKWDARRQSDGGPFGVSIGASLEGQNNLHLDPQPSVSAALSRLQGTWLALYVNPTYVHDAHTPTLQLAHEGHGHGGAEVDDVDIPGEEHSDTVYIGLGLRARIRETVSLVAEVSPRVFGYRPDRAAWNIGIEKLTRGHVLQLNFGNNFDSTPGMVARGGSPHDVYMGFNMSRRF